VFYAQITESNHGGLQFNLRFGKLCQFVIRERLRRGNSLPRACHRRSH
jgi:hypothetical protein